MKKNIEEKLYIGYLWIFIICILIMEKYGLYYLIKYYRTLIPPVSRTHNNNNFTQEYISIFLFSKLFTYFFYILTPHFIN